VIRVAAFDVDGTLTARDCVVPFLRQAAGTPTLSGRMLRHPIRMGSAVWRRDRDALKAAAATAAFSGVPFADLQPMAKTFAQEVHADGLRLEVVGCLEEHLAAGDEVILVSASFEIYLEPLAEMLGVETVLATRLAVDSDGICTGEIEGPNCRGAEKVKRLHTWLEAVHGGRDNVHVTAYGDSRGDCELLGDANVAQWVTDTVPTC
jgi:phosphatidylglycerophosphatase C